MLMVKKNYANCHHCMFKELPSFTTEHSLTDSFINYILRMLVYWHLTSSCLLLIWVCCSNAICPPYCTCHQSDKGKKKVSCISGDMTEPIPTDEMDANIEILQISAPNNNHMNNLPTIPAPSLFQKFKSIEELHITRSNVQQIAMHAFWGVPSLKLLNLTGNSLNTVVDHNFRGLVNLVELNLDDNKIEQLASGAFKHLTELRILTLQRNYINDLVPRVFLKLTKLHVLKLNGNKFDDLSPEAFKDIPDLRVLECRACGLKRINTQIYHLLPYLNHLDLGNNQMQFIASDEFRDLHRLHSLKLDGNLLPVVLEHTFVNQQQLKYLCLARNRLAKITNTAFLNLSSLQDLDIGYNKLSKMEGLAMTHLTETLQRLVISGNSFTLEVIKVILQALPQLKVLEMAQMKLDNWPEGFLPTRIRKLDVSKNNLTNISVDMFPAQLQEVDLSFNKIRGLGERLVLKLEKMKVNLQGNPWICDLCHVTGMLYRVNKSKLFDGLTCSGPRYLKGKLLATLRLEDVTTCNSLNVIDYDDEAEAVTGRSDKFGLIIGLICIVALTVVAIVFVVYSCVRRHSRNIAEQRKRASAGRHQQENHLEGAVAIFSKGEISFKFPLDLTEPRMSVSTIDEIKKGACTHAALPNGTGTGI